MDFINQISTNINCKSWQVNNVLSLFKEGATIPFIARYRKEKTGELDEVQIAEIQKLNAKFEEFARRKNYILKSMEELGVLTNELNQKINDAKEVGELEDIYLPFKPKRKTKASVARENGLEPLAKIIMAQNSTNLMGAASKYAKKGLSSDQALQGAKHIISEWVSENSWVRNVVRNEFKRNAEVKSKLIKGKEDQGIKFKDYFDFSEPVYKCKTHRILALFRGENEEILRLKIQPDPKKVIDTIEKRFIKSMGESAVAIKEAIDDSYKRLLRTAMESELRSSLKEKADEEAIDVFSKNLKQLLLAAPLGQKRILAIDPGFKSGCKLACLDAQGNLVHNENIYPHAPQNEKTQAMKKLSTMVETYNIEAIAIGNGTASRETEALIKRIHFDRKLLVFIVSEDGASIYSASSIARKEFPQYDVTVRGAISIGRRLMDPLAELVKIDPKSIGVGQYQHDVSQVKLKESLEIIVESAVNSVGVNLNTASKYLLTHVSGVGPTLADNILSYRKENGTFKSRKELKKVTRMGDKAYEQCAGFLRVPDAVNPLDNSAVHPEAYSIASKMAKSAKISIKELIGNEEIITNLNLNQFVTDDFGLATLNDIKDELLKPGRDPRKKAKLFEFAKGIHKMEDIIVGAELPGIVTNITNFGAFVDVGIKQDGLLHISNMADKFISDPNEIVTLHEHVKVEVLEVDVARKRIGFRLIAENI